MSNNVIKELFIFDFDDTLVVTKSKVYVINEKNKTKNVLTHTEYYDYILNEGEFFDISEFDKVINPKINQNLINLLKKNQNKSVILTARDKAEPVKEFLLSININVPVNAIGLSQRGINLNFVNAKRKKEWIKLAIEKGNYEKIQVWDDNNLNLFEINSLKNELSNKITIITHLVEL